VALWMGGWAVGRWALGHLRHGASEDFKISCLFRHANTNTRAETPRLCPVMCGFLIFLSCVQINKPTVYVDDPPGAKSTHSFF